MALLLCCYFGTSEILIVDERESISFLLDPLNRLLHILFLLMQPVENMPFGRAWIAFRMD